MAPVFRPKSGLSVVAALACASLAGACAVPQVTMPTFSMGSVTMPDPPAMFGLPPERTPFAGIPFSTWQEAEPGYRFYPGDVVDVTLPTAPELNRSVTVQPDGRITLPYINPVMAADRTVPELQYVLSQAYSATLTRPQVEVSLKTSTPLKMFVGGEVDKPGVYDMPGDVSALQAVIMAGGLRATAKSQQAVLIRRGFNDQPMMRTIDLRRATFAPGTTDAVAMRRGDILIVPRTTIASWDIFVQQYLRDGIPVQFGRSLDGTQFFTTK